MTKDPRLNSHSVEVGVVGSGVTGSRVVAQLATLDYRKLVLHDTNNIKVRQLGHLHQSHILDIEVANQNRLTQCDVVVLACSTPHATLARYLIESGVSVVSVSDSLSDVVEMLKFDELVRCNAATLVLGVAASPGLTGLLVHQATQMISDIDEVHVALHGTGGPDCARQHHVALSGQSIGWHDGDWLRRPAGSGRELCWFPEPVGAHDCYRAEMADPVLLKYALPNLQRITARMSATRRDRFTSRLPMLAPPHAEGGTGSVRVEVRGWRSGSRIVEILGVAERVAQIAGVVAAATVHELVSGSFAEPGVVALGSPQAPNERILRLVQDAGIHLHEFVGN